MGRGPVSAGRVSQVISGHAACATVPRSHVRWLGEPPPRRSDRVSPGGESGPPGALGPSAASPDRCPTPSAASAAAGWYAHGADWAQAVDFTVVVTLRCDVTPLQLVAATRTHRRPWTALVRGCGQAYALHTVAPVTSRCGTRRVCQARSSGSERDTRARPHAVAPMHGVPEDSRRRSTCTGRTHAPRARADGTQTPSSTVAVRAPAPS